MGALHANQAHSGDMGATSPGAKQRGLWNWQSSGAVRAPEPVLNSTECSSIRDPRVGLQQLRGQSIGLPQAEPIMWRRSASGQALLTSLPQSTGIAQALAPTAASELNPPSPSHHLQPVLRLALPRSQPAATVSGARFDSPTFGAAAEDAGLKSLGQHPMQGVRSPNGGEIGPSTFRPFRDINQVI